MDDDMGADMDADMDDDMGADMDDDMDDDIVTTMGGNKGGSKSSSMNTDIDEDDMDDDKDMEEGFQGSQHIECQTLRKMLLALLITFLGYMLILGFTNNLIPITTYAPEFKQFKHLIYGGFFFIIVYICLEVF